MVEGLDQSLAQTWSRLSLLHVDILFGPILVEVLRPPIPIKKVLVRRIFSRLGHSYSQPSFVS
jgi:hypothetical protein